MFNIYLLQYRTSKTIDTSITQLSNYVQLATDSIFSSVERCPLILRQALKLVWERVISKLSQNVIQFPLRLFVYYCILLGYSVHCRYRFYIFEVFCSGNIVSQTICYS